MRGPATGTLACPDELSIQHLDMTRFGSFFSKPGPKHGRPAGQRQRFERFDWKSGYSSSAHGLYERLLNSTSIAAVERTMPKGGCLIQASAWASKLKPPVGLAIRDVVPFFPRDAGITQGGDVATISI